MWMCRQVAKALAENRYYELPRRRRIGMYIHIYLCGMCGRFHRQVVAMQEGVRQYLDQEKTSSPPEEIHLSDDARHRIEEALKENS